MPRIAKTAVLVVLLTALIWAWAEQSQIATLPEHRIALAIRMPDDRWLVLADEGGAAPAWSRTITLPLTATYTGPQSGISELDRQVKQLDYVLPQPADDARQVTLDLAEVLGDQPILTQLHTGVSEVHPKTITLRLARLQEYTLNVVPAYSDLGARQAECRPDKVAVRLPNDVYDPMERKEIRALVTVGPNTDLSQPITVELPDRLGGYKIEPIPRMVTVVTNIMMAEQGVENVPVRATFPPDFPLQDYSLDSEKHQWRKTIVARGPADRTLAVNDIQVVLQFEQTDTKPTDVFLSRDVEIILPQGFVLISPQPNDPDRGIKFRFIKRAEERPPP